MANKESARAAAKGACQVKVAPPKSTIQSASIHEPQHHENIFDQTGSSSRRRKEQQTCALWSHRSLRDFSSPRHPRTDAKKRNAAAPELTPAGDEDVNFDQPPGVPSSSSPSKDLPKARKKTDRVSQEVAPALDQSHQSEKGAENLLVNKKSSSAKKGRSWEGKMVCRCGPVIGKSLIKVH